MTELSGPATRLTIWIGESDQWHHKPLFTEIVHRAHRAGLAGASVFHGIEGYGKSRHIHTTRILSLSEDLPCQVVVIDSDEKVRRFLADIEGLVTEGMITLDQVQVVKYAGRTEAPDEPR